MTDKERVLERLRRGPVHSTELRKAGITANPSQRVAELRERGCVISAESAPWTDARGKRRPGSIYSLVSEPTPVIAPAPLSPDPDTGALFDAGELAILHRPSYRDPDAA